MSTVDLVLTDSRMWARSESTHWDGAPSVVPVSDGSSLIAGEPLQPPYPAVSVVRLAEADRLAFVPMLPTVADAFAAVFGTALANLHLPGPCTRLTVVSPTDWGARRRNALEAGARRLVGEVDVEPLALRVAALSASTSQHQRIAVVELNPLTMTVTLAGRSGDQIWLVACEHEPTLGSADLDEGRSVESVVDVIDRVLGRRKPSYLVILGLADPTRLEAMHAELTRRYGFGVDMRPMSGVDLIRGTPSRPTVGPTYTVQPTAWTGSLQERAAAVQPAPKRRTPLYLGTAAAVVAVLIVTAAIVVLFGKSGDDTATAQSAITPSPTTPGPASAPPAPTKRFGRVDVRLPAGWHVTKHSDTQVALSPDSGARERISMVQSDLAAGSGMAEVAAALETQISKRSDGTVASLERDVAFGGRTGLSYVETPGDGTTVRWQVMVDSGVQISVGCQYPTGEWEKLVAVCEKFVGDLRIVE